jgi:hypothetical protein
MITDQGFFQKIMKWWHDSKRSSAHRGEEKLFQVVALFESFPDREGHNKEIILVDFPFPLSKFVLQGRRESFFFAFVT